MLYVMLYIAPSSASYLVQYGIIAVAVWIFFAVLRRRRTIKMIEEMILQSDKTDNNDALLAFCNQKGISDEKLGRIAEDLYIRLAEDINQRDPFIFSMAAVYANNNQAQCKYFTRAAQYGDVDAMYSLGLGYMHLDGEESKYGDNPEESYYWFRLAADRGHLKAQERVASAFLWGEGVQKNEDQAFSYAKDCSDRGNAHCSLFLVTYFYKSIRSQYLNIPEAIALLKRVMAKGDRELFAEAAWYLGSIYGNEYVHGGQPDEYSDRYKAAYCYALAYFADDWSPDHLKVGYQATDFELNKWRKDAMALRCDL